MWEHPCTDCVCPMPLVEELDLMWPQVTPFLSVCWKLSLSLGCGAGDGVARAGASV